MRTIRVAALIVFSALSIAHAGSPPNGTVYSYVKDGVRHYSANPPPPGSSQNRVIKYRPISSSDLFGTWVEKSGDASFIFGDGYNFEYRVPPNPKLLGDSGTDGKGIWTLGPGSCSVGDTKGNLYIQSGTSRCCHNAYFLGANLVLTAVVPPRFIGVCSDRVLIRPDSSE